VTGAAGFAGGHLLELLSGREDLVAWTRAAAAPAVTGEARWQAIDLLDRDRVRSALRELRPVQVYHLAGTPHVAESFGDTAKPLAGNVLATHHLFDGLRRAGVSCRVLVSGSATVYASSDSPLTEQSPLGPASPYAVSKLAQEQLGLRAVTEDGLDVIVARAFNHTGRRQKPSFMASGIARQIALIEHGQLDPILRIGNTAPSRDLSDVRDVVRAYEALMRTGTPGAVYNVASGIGHTVREILDAFLTRCRLEVRVEVDPGRVRRNDVPVLIGDPTRLQQSTGWRPQISFDEMIDDLLEFWRQAITPS